MWMRNVVKLYNTIYHTLDLFNFSLILVWNMSLGCGIYNLSPPYVSNYTYIKVWNILYIYI